MQLPAAVLAVIILLSGFVVFKNLPINQPQPTADKGFQATMNQQTEASPSASLKPTVSYKPTPKPSSTPKPTTSPTPQSTSSSSSSSSNNSSSGNTNTSTNNTNSSPTPTPAPSENPSESFSNNGLTVKATCNGSELNLYIKGTINTPRTSGSGVYMAIEDNSTGQRMIYEYVGSGDYPTADVAANIPPTGPIRGSGITISNDGRSYTSKAYYGPYTNNYPSLDTVLAEVTFSKKCP